MSENYKSIWLEGVDFNDEVTGAAVRSIRPPSRARAGGHPGMVIQFVSAEFAVRFERHQHPDQVGGNRARLGLLLPS
jgi:hypothetical protein